MNLRCYSTLLKVPFFSSVSRDVLWFSKARAGLEANNKPSSPQQAWTHTLTCSDSVVKLRSSGIGQKNWGMHRQQKSQRALQTHVHSFQALFPTQRVPACLSGHTGLWFRGGALWKAYLHLGSKKWENLVWYPWLGSWTSYSRLFPLLPALGLQSPLLGKVNVAFTFSKVIL